MEVLKRTVFVASQATAVKLVEEDLKANFGADGYSSVVATTGGFFVTFVSNDDADTCVEHGMLVGEEFCVATKVGSREILIVLSGLPEFVTDEAVKEKFMNLKCELKSEVLWARENGKYYGQRSIKLVLPEGISSLPYTIRIRDVMGLEANYKLRHDRQVKVCNRCFSTSHLYRQCPEFTCRKCGVQGHVIRNCPEWGTVRRAQPDAPVIQPELSKDVVELNAPTEVGPDDLEDAVTTPGEVADTRVVSAGGSKRSLPASAGSEEERDPAIFDTPVKSVSSVTYAKKLCDSASFRRVSSDGKFGEWGQSSSVQKKGGT